MCDRFVHCTLSLCQSNKAMTVKDTFGLWPCSDDTGSISDQQNFQNKEQQGKVHQRVCRIRNADCIEGILDKVGKVCVEPSGSYYTAGAYPGFCSVK